MSELANFMLEHGVVGFFKEPLTLKSGRKSHYYVNWRHVSSDAFLLDKISVYALEALERLDWKAECIYGVPEGATKLALACGIKKAKNANGPGEFVLPMGRAKPKEHGNPEDRYFIGQPKGRVVVVEDTITTGVSLFHCLDQLIEANIDVVGVLALTDRKEALENNESFSSKLTRLYEGRIQYHALISGPEVVRSALTNQSIDKKLREEIELELEQAKKLLDQ